MILTKKILHVPGSIHYQRYKNLGYTIVNAREQILIKIEDLPRQSTKKIFVQCDVCQKQLWIAYNQYINSHSKHGIFACTHKCCYSNTRLTNKEKYGHEHTFQIEEFDNARKATWNKNYGVDNPWKLSSVQNKIRETQISEYGRLYVQTQEFKDKSKLTCQNNYGVEHNSQSEIIKEKKRCTNLKNIGFDTPFQSPSCKLKSIETCNKKYGCDYPIQNQLIFSTRFHTRTKFYNNELFYQSSYELDFIELCISNNINIKNGITIKYKFDDKNKYYFPDFYVSAYNLLIEIKSSYYYNRDIIRNNLKMKAAIDSGYNFLFIIDKNYLEFKQKTNIIC